MRIQVLRVLTLLLTLGPSTAALDGCSNRHVLPNQVASEWQSPSSPSAAVDSLIACWERLDGEHYPELLAADFVFHLEADTILWRPLWADLRRADEIEAARAILSGTATQPAASSIDIVRRNGLEVVPDPRSGKSPTFHRVLRAYYDFILRTPDYVFEVNTELVFYAVRADSAAIPDGAPTAAPDTSRWYVERWDEMGPLVAGPSGLHAPTDRPWTWADIKNIYLDRTRLARPAWLE